MARENSPLIIGDYWLDKRRDGKSPDIWQIAHYSPESRSVIYRSTKRRTVDVEAAKEILRTHEAGARSTQQGQAAEVSELLPHLFNYLREHGPDVGRLDTCKSSFRAWIGFLMQDEHLDTGAKVADITPSVVARFRRWRMGPHSWNVEWGGKPYNHRSTGVTGHAVQRNIDDLRAALNHAEGERRTLAPKVPSVNKKLRQKKFKAPLTPKQLGAIWGYAKQDIGVWREIALMMGTTCRPGVALAFDPETQWQGDIIDLQPEGRDLTDKRNAMVPAIDPLKPILQDWRDSPHPKVASRKQWWETARRALSMPDVEAYDIRHAVTTFMDDQGVPGAQLSGIAGHIPESRKIARTTSDHYLHYNPHNATKGKRALTKFFRLVEAAAGQWIADHRRTIPVRGRPISIERTTIEC